MAQLSELDLVQDRITAVCAPAAAHPSKRLSAARALLNAVSGLLSAEVHLGDMDLESADRCEEYVHSEIDIALERLRFGSD